MIRVENLSLFLDEKPLLQNLNFEIFAGQTLALVGESGGGKTTLARLLLGLLQGRPLKTGETLGPGIGFTWSGAAWLGKINLLTAGRKQMQILCGREISLIVQALSDALNPQLTVLQHIEEFLQIHGLDDRNAVDEAVAYNIPKRVLYRYPVNLSGGEIQRVLTALALLNNPACLILDEPTASLDMANREIALRAFEHGLADRCQILITHDIDFARRFATQVAVMKQGRFVETGPVDVVLTNPKTQYTQQFLKQKTTPEWLKQRSVARCATAEPARLQDKGKPRFLVQDLNHTIDGQLLLHGVSMSVAAGQCLAIHGASGSGKTTLARILAGFEPLQSGHVQWQERGMSISPVAALIPQHPHRAMARTFTVEEVLHEAMWFGPEVQDDLKCILRQSDLPQNQSFLRRRTVDLSGGEAQRLVLARALILRPQVLIADEPTSALDVQTRMHVIETLRRAMRDHKMAVILVTHDLWAATALADHTCNLAAGRLVEVSAPARILTG